MNAFDRIIKELVYSASGRFTACETKEDLLDQQRLYEELLRERIGEIMQLRMKEAPVPARAIALAALAAGERE